MGVTGSAGVLLCPGSCIDDVEAFRCPTGDEDGTNPRGGTGSSGNSCLKYALIVYHNQQQAPAMAASSSGEHTLITRKMISRRLLLTCQRVGNCEMTRANSPQLGTVTKNNASRNTAPTTSEGISGGAFLFPKKEL